jgi:hypothetical protein
MNCLEMLAVAVVFVIAWPFVLYIFPMFVMEKVIDKLWPDASPELNHDPQHS